MDKFVHWLTEVPIEPDPQTLNEQERAVLHFRFVWLTKATTFFTLFIIATYLNARIDDAIPDTILTFLRSPFIKDILLKTTLTICALGWLGINAVILSRAISNRLPMSFWFSSLDKALLKRVFVPVVTTLITCELLFFFLRYFYGGI